MEENWSCPEPLQATQPLKLLLRHVRFAQYPKIEHEYTLDYTSTVPAYVLVIVWMRQGSNFLERSRRVMSLVAVSTFPRSFLLPTGHVKIRVIMM